MTIYELNVARDGHMDSHLPVLERFRSRVLAPEVDRVNSQEPTLWMMIHHQGGIDLYESTNDSIRLRRSFICLQREPKLSLRPEGGPSSMDAMIKVVCKR